MTHPIAFILGGHPCVFEDMDKALARLGPIPHLVIAANYAGVSYPGRLDAWVSLHPYLFESMRAERAAMGLNTDYRAFTTPPEWAERTGAEFLPYRWRGASSGIYAAQAALDIYCAKPLLLGVPLDACGPHIRHKGRFDYEQYREHFLNVDAGERAHVRSMSGWTAEQTGTPDLHWLMS